MLSSEASVQQTALLEDYKKKSVVLGDVLVAENLSVLFKRHLVRLNYVPLQACHLDQVVATTWNAAVFLLVAVVNALFLYTSLCYVRTRV